jgi:UDP-glucose 4-epimerase
MSKYCLITGGNGYIGSHIVRTLLNRGASVLSVDLQEFSIGKSSMENAKYIQCDIRNLEQLEEIFRNFDIDTVLHFAALKSVYESSIIPKEYELTNVTGTRNILETMIKYDVKNLVFPSTAAVYGETQTGIFTEFSTLKPGSVYGQTKLDAENIIRQFSSRYPLNAIIFRFFNVAGTYFTRSEEKPPDNFIPIAISNYKNRIQTTVYGSDYQTPDHTAIRDYVYIGDIVEACLKSMDLLTLSNGYFDILNIGSGKGYSVLEVLDEIANQFGELIPHKFAPRRPGDLPVAIAESSRLSKILGYQNKFRLSDIISSLI